MALDREHARPGGAFRWRQFPWWLVIMIAMILATAVLIITKPVYQQIFATILTGLGTTLFVTGVSFGCALVTGLILGLGRISRNIAVRNLATLYIEFIRGVPVLVLIFTIAFAIVPALASLIGFPTNAFSFTARAIIALVMIYSAYIAEIFRAGIESIGRGQMEAARSLGMSNAQAMRTVILPQAVRNVLPALGNDLIALLKDTSLVSVLAVRDITQVSRLSLNTTFLYEETYLVLTLFYLSMTLLLSLLLQYVQRWASKGRAA
ncbi:MAG TPA: amino acid ABC transporter permease [Herpetosiphonaceae bacterium]